MFNELTLLLQIILLVSLYVFLLFAVRIISKDLSVTRKEVKERFPVITLLEGGAIGPSGPMPVTDQILIGRAPDCDIILDDTFASTHHARVYLAGSSCWLEDLKSTNGTMVKGKRIEKPVKLSSGSQFRIGQTVFQFTD